MKRFSALVFLISLFSNAICAQDVVRVIGCTRVWKNQKPINNTMIKVSVNGIVYTVPTGPGKHCAEVLVPVAGLPADTPIGIYATKDSSGLEDQLINGLSMLDAEEISCHILGLEPLSSPFAMVATDINRSGSMITSDLVELQRVILGIYTKWPNILTWQFLPEFITFPDPSNPFKTPFDITLPLQQFKAYHNDTLNVLGIKIGDVDADVNTTGPYTGPTQYADTAFMTLPDVIIPANTTLDVTTAAFLSSVNSLQVELLTSSGVKIVGVSSLVNLHALNDSTFRITVFRGATSFPLKFQVKIATTETVDLKDVLRIGNGILPWAFTKCGDPNKTYKVKLRFAGTLPVHGPAETPLRATPAAPNPFTDKALVNIELPEAMPVLLEVFDLGGRLTWRQEQVLGSGQQQVEIPAEAVAPGSMGLYRVRAGTGVARGKVVRE